VAEYIHFFSWKDRSASDSIINSSNSSSLVCTCIDVNGNISATTSQKVFMVKRCLLDQSFINIAYIGHFFLYIHKCSQVWAQKLPKSDFFCQKGVYYCTKRIFSATVVIKWWDLNHQVQKIYQWPHRFSSSLITWSWRFICILMHSQWEGSFLLPFLTH